MTQGIGSEALTRFMELVATAIEMFGVAVIALAVVAATTKFVLDFRGGERRQAYNTYRANLGRGILLGLELLLLRFVRTRMPDAIFRYRAEMPPTR